MTTRAGVLISACVALIAAPALAQGYYGLPDPQPYARYVEWMRSIDDDQSKIASIDWLAVDAAYRMYLEGVEKSRLGSDEQAIEARATNDRNASDDARARAGALFAESWNRLKSLDDALLAATESAIPEATRSHFDRVRNLVTVSRCATGAALISEIGSEAPLLSYFATMEVPSDDAALWGEGVDALLVNVAAKCVALRSAELALIRNYGGRVDEKRWPESRAMGERCLEAERDVEQAFESGLVALTAHVSEPTAIAALRADVLRFPRYATGGSSDGWEGLHELVVRADVDDDAFKSIETIVQEVNASRISYLKKRNELLVACVAEDRRWLFNGGQGHSDAPVTAYSEFSNRHELDRSRAEVSFRERLGITDWEEFWKRPPNPKPNDAQRRLLALIHTKPLPHLPSPKRGWMTTTRAPIDPLPEPWVRQALDRTECETMIAALGFEGARGEDARAAFDQLARAWATEVEPLVLEATACGDRLNWTDSAQQHTGATRQYADWKAARDAAEKLEAAYFARVLELATTNAARNEIRAWHCRRAVGDPAMAARRYPLPRGFTIDAISRRGNLALAVMHAELEPAELETAQTIIAAQADTLVRTSLAADRAEMELLGAVDLAQFAFDTASQNGPRSIDELSQDNVAARTKAAEGLVAPFAARKAAQDSARQALQSVLAPAALDRIDRAHRILLFPGLERDRQVVEAALETARLAASDDETRSAIVAAGDRWRGTWMVLNDRIAEIGWPGRASVPGGDGRGAGWREHHRTDFLLWRRAQETAMLIEELARLRKPA